MCVIVTQCSVVYRLTRSWDSRSGLGRQTTSTGSGPTKQQTASRGSTAGRDSTVGLQPEETVTVGLQLDETVSSVGRLTATD